MARMPEYMQIDKAGLASMLSFAPARASLLREIGTRQHALMSGFGGHPQIFSVFVDGTSVAEERQVLFRVPPGVTKAQVSVLEAGPAGFIDIYTATDTDGVRLFAARGAGGTRATMRWNFGSYNDNTFALTNRLLILAASATEDWRTVTGTIEVDGPAVFAVALVYMHPER